MDKNQAGRLARAREVLNEKPAPGPRETGEIINDLAVQVGRLDYWLRDIIALAAELDGQASEHRPAGAAADAELREQGAAIRSAYAAAVKRAPHGWSTPTALEGYGYTLPADYLSGCTCTPVAGSHRADCAWSAQ